MTKQQEQEEEWSWICALLTISLFITEHNVQNKSLVVQVSKEKRRISFKKLNLSSSKPQTKLNYPLVRPSTPNPGQLTPRWPRRCPRRTRPSASSCSSAARAWRACAASAPPSWTSSWSRRRRRRTGGPGGPPGRPPSLSSRTPSSETTSPCPARGSCTGLRENGEDRRKRVRRSGASGWVLRNWLSEEVDDGCVIVERAVMWNWCNLCFGQFTTLIYQFLVNLTKML